MGEPQEEKPEEKPKELTIIVFTSRESENCKLALEDAKRIAEEEGAGVEEIDIEDMEFSKDMIEGTVPATCVASKGDMQCHVGFGDDYKQKLLELIKKLREQLGTKSQQ